MLRITRKAKGEVILKVSGRLNAENLAEMMAVIAAESKVSHIVLDLKDLTLVDQQAVEFLGQCETNAVRLRNCPIYVRDWIDLSRKQKPGRNK
jgi:anti-anti-sigma regulatory factor